MSESVAATAAAAAAAAAAAGGGRGGNEINSWSSQIETMQKLYTF